MRIYLAGPMRGYPQFNFPAFNDAARRLRRVGHVVINPAEVDIAFGFDPEHDPVTPELVRQCVRRDVEAITSVDGVVMLPGWLESTGARAEKAVAHWVGIEVSAFEPVGDDGYEMRELLPVPPMGPRR